MVVCGMCFGPKVSEGQDKNPHQYCNDPEPGQLLHDASKLAAPLQRYLSVQNIPSREDADGSDFLAMGVLPSSLGLNPTRRLHHKILSPRMMDHYRRGTLLRLQQ